MNIFNDDGSVKNPAIASTAKTEVSDAPGTYVLDGISEADGYPETFEGKCLLVIAGTTQPMVTNHTLFANKSLYYRLNTNDTWKKLDYAFADTGHVGQGKMPLPLEHFLGCVSELPETAAEGDYAIYTITGTVHYYADGWQQVPIPVTSVLIDTNNLSPEIATITDGDISPVIGVCVRSTGGSYNWYRIDQYGQPVEPNKYYFDKHPVYSKIKRTVVDGQVMQEHHKFYYKAIDITEGPFAGQKGRIISPERLDGFKPYASFMKDGKEVDKWYCGSFRASLDGNSKLCSLPGQVIASNIIYNTIRQYAQNRTGFDMWNVYQVSECWLLALLEAGTADIQNYYTVKSSETAASSDVTDIAKASWRGHVGLWTEQYCLFSGLQINSSNQVLVWKNDGTQEFVNTGFTSPTDSWVLWGGLKTGSGVGYDFDDFFYPSSTVATGNVETSAIIPSYSFIRKGIPTVAAAGGGGNGYNGMCLVMWAKADEDDNNCYPYYNTRISKV